MRRRRPVWGACIIAIVLTAASGIAQPVFSVQDLDRAMKAVGRFVGLAQGAIAAGDFASAKRARGARASSCSRR